MNLGEILFVGAITGFVGILVGVGIVFSSIPKHDYAQAILSDTVSVDSLLCNHAIGTMFNVAPYSDSEYTSHEIVDSEGTVVANVVVIYRHGFVTQDELIAEDKR